MITDPWLAACRVQTPTGSPGPADDTVTTTQAVTAGLHPDLLVYAQSSFRVDPPSPTSNEVALHIERLFRLQHVIARPRQLVHQRLGCHDTVRMGFLAVEESPRLLVEPACKVRCFDERPHQIGVTVLGVSFNLLFAVGITRTVHATRIGAKFPTWAKRTTSPVFSMITMASSKHDKTVDSVAS